MRQELNSSLLQVSLGESARLLLAEALRAIADDLTRDIPHREAAAPMQDGAALQDAVRAILGLPQ